MRIIAKHFTYSIPRSFFFVFLTPLADPSEFFFLKNFSPLAHRRQKEKFGTVASPSAWLGLSGFAAYGQKKLWLACSKNLCS